MTTAQAARRAAARVLKAQHHSDEAIIAAYLALITLADELEREKADG